MSAQRAAPHSDQGNTLALTAVHVTVGPAPFNRGDFPGFSDLRQAVVTYDASYIQVYGSRSGPQVRIVHVGRRGATGS